VTGPPLPEHAREELRRRIGAECAEVIADLQLAARFLSEGDSEAQTAAELPLKRLSFGESTRSMWLPFPQARFDRVVASLFISYLFDPEVVLRDFYRMLAPEGQAVISSMRPDSDISLLFTGYVQDARQSRYADLASAREMLNEAAGLFEREEEGYFRFFDEAELTRAMESAGFSEIHTERALGTPPQAIIAVGKREP
jgi:ubiquinone/menaquinone biosynthesis C-methylase UbiE